MVVGCDVSTGRPSAGTAAWPFGLPADGSAAGAAAAVVGAFVVVVVVGAAVVVGGA
jgi:hypothetical protein